MILLVLPDIAEEDRLLALARRGDQTAIIAIYDRYFEPVYQFLRMRIDDPQQAEDLAAEVFVRMMTAFKGRNAPRHSLRGWLFRVARNILADHYGQRKRLTTATLEEWLPAPESTHPDTQVFAAMEAASVRRAIRQLTGEQQEVIVLRFGQMLSLRETADIMGKRVGAVKGLQFRALARLRDVLAADGNLS